MEWMDAKLMGLLRVLIRSMGREGFCIVILLDLRKFLHSLRLLYRKIKTFKLRSTIYYRCDFIILICFQSNF